MGASLHSSGSRPVARGVRQSRQPEQLRRRALQAFALLIAFALAASADVTHVVSRGDNLTRIARRYGSTSGAIAATNGIADPNLIRIGQRLIIPGSPPSAPPGQPPATGVHVVASGENLTKIARRYGSTASELARINGIANPSLIRAGQRLKVPAPPKPGVEGLLEKYAAQYGVEPSLVKALAWQESGWQQSVVSAAGAVGVMQVLPETARFTGKYLLKTEVDLGDTEQNIRAGVRFLSYLLSLTGGDQSTAVAGYFQGLRSVRASGISPKTARYVANVMALKKRFS